MEITSRIVIALIAALAIAWLLAVVGFVILLIFDVVEIASFT